MKKRTTLHLVMITLAALFVTACPRAETAEDVTPETQTGTFLTGERRDLVPVTQSGQTVIVVVSEDAVGVPTEIPPGPVIFSVTNGGETPLGFRIEGPGVELQLGVPLDPGASGDLQANLPEGVYTIRALVNNVPDTGAAIQIRVTL
jgi:hypothetical protein